MKRFLFSLFCLLSILVGCESGISADFARPTEATPLSLLIALNDQTIHSDATLFTDVEEGGYESPDESQFAAVFGDGDSALDLTFVEHYAVRSANLAADEIIIIAIKDESAGEKVKTFLSSRIASRCQAYGLSVTDQNALVNQKGKFIYSVLTKNAAAVGHLLLAEITAAYENA